MKRPRTLVREIESNQARIAVLREDHARTGQEISYLVVANKAKVMELVGAEIERLDLGQLPIHDLLSSLSKLGEGGVVDNVLPTSLPEAEANIQAFVKLSRNASASNRRMLESAGLHWHGRDGGWTGNVTPDGLAHLRLAFGERVVEEILHCLRNVFQGPSLPTWRRLRRRPGKSRGRLTRRFWRGSLLPRRRRRCARPLVSRAALSDSRVGM